MTVYRGYMELNGSRVEIDFESPSVAGNTERDAAFLQAASRFIKWEYLPIRERPLESTTHPLACRNVWRELRGCMFLDIKGDPGYTGDFESIQVDWPVVAEQILSNYPDCLIDRETFDRDTVFAECLQDLSADFLFSFWEGAPLSDFLGKHRNAHPSNEVVCLQYPRRPTEQSESLAGKISAHALKEAIPIPDGWQLSNDGLMLLLHGSSRLTQ